MPNAVTFFKFNYFHKYLLNNCVLEMFARVVIFLKLDNFLLPKHMMKIIIDTRLFSYTKEILNFRIRFQCEINIHTVVILLFTLFLNI